jgi:hypothetical protein
MILKYVTSHPLIRSSYSPQKTFLFFFRGPKSHGWKWCTVEKFLNVTVTFLKKRFCATAYWMFRIGILSCNQTDLCKTYWFVYCYFSKIALLHFDIEIAVFITHRLTKILKKKFSSARPRIECIGIIHF